MFVKGINGVKETNDAQPLDMVVLELNSGTTLFATSNSSPRLLLAK